MIEKVSIIVKLHLTNGTILERTIEQLDEIDGIRTFIDRLQKWKVSTEPDERPISTPTAPIPEKPELNLNQVKKIFEEDKETQMLSLMEKVRDLLEEVAPLLNKIKDELEYRKDVIFPDL